MFISSFTTRWHVENDRVDDPDMHISGTIETLSREELRDLVDHLERKLKETKEAAPKALKSMMAEEQKRFGAAERKVKELTAKLEEKRKEEKNVKCPEVGLAMGLILSALATIFVSISSGLVAGLLLAGLLVGLVFALYIPSAKNPTDFWITAASVSVIGSFLFAALFSVTTFDEKDSRISKRIRRGRYCVLITSKEKTSQVGAWTIIIPEKPEEKKEKY